jgi:putative protease
MTDPSKVELRFTDETGVSAAVTCEGVFEPARDPEKMAATVREQLGRSGDTIFEVGNVEILSTPNISAIGVPIFIPVSTLARLRREGLEKLLEARTKLAPERDPAVEDLGVRVPRTYLTAAANVTNRLAESFWRDHGVTEIASAIELRGAESGEALMRTRYCIRREMDECLKEGAGKWQPEHDGPWLLKPGSELFLVRGNTRLRLEFDCKNCEMLVTKI